MIYEGLTGGEVGFTGHNGDQGNAYHARPAAHGKVPGVVVSRVNMSPRFVRELIDALEDNWSKWVTREGIKNLPETPEQS